MSKKNLTNMLTVFLTMTLLFANSVLLLPLNVVAATPKVDYLRNDDCFVMSPAESFDGLNTFKEIPLGGWQVTVQDEGNINGNDIQMWKFGISSKFRVRSLDANNTFKIQITDYQESKYGKYWDVEGRSISSGAIIHAWSGRDSNDASQRFYLEEDQDNNPETFYIKNLNSDKYLVPRDYYKNPENNNEQNENWDNNGCNVIQSRYPFLWQINVLNRETPGTQSYTNWMSRLDDDKYLSQLNIPGTHDSCTANVWGGDVAGVNITACQKYFIDEQLIAGIRAFDLRTNENDDSGTFVMIHSKKYCVCHMPNGNNMTLYSVLDEMIDFLKHHPRESLIVALKIDGDNNKEVKLRLAKLLLDKYLNDPVKQNYFYQWYGKENSSRNMGSPTLKDVRGKIVILSRVNFSQSNIGNEFQEGALLRSYMGPDISEWDNTYDNKKLYAQAITPKTSPVKVWIQDDYKCDNFEKKNQFFNTIDQLNGTLQNEEEYASVEKPNNSDFVFNYSSRTLSHSDSMTPLSGARFMNELILENSKFSITNGNRLGIVMMDYADKAVASRIIENNVDKNKSAMLLSGRQQLVWPTGATVTYGSILGEAALHFDDPEKANTTAGFYYFENSTDILTVKDDNGKTQTLIFESYDGTVKKSMEIPVTVNQRQLPIKVGNYEIEYGEKFDITQASYPSAGGYFLPSDQEKLNMITAASGLRYKAVDIDGNNIDITTKTKPCRGIIRLTADNPDEIKHPNYNTFVEDGVWVIQPRTIEVSWSYQANGWKANIDNIINGDEVIAVVNTSADGKSATLTLDGGDADAYRIAEGDEISPVKQLDNPKTSDIPVYAVLMILFILGPGVCGFLIRKKLRVK